MGAADFVFCYSDDYEVVFDGVRTRLENVVTGVLGVGKFLERRLALFFSVPSVEPCYGVVGRQDYYVVR